MEYYAKSDWSGGIASFSRHTPITRNHTGILTAYQQKYTITYMDEMQADFDDIRFNTQADGNGDYLPYWIESKTDSDTADVWIKSDYASGDDIIYMFYGNSSLTSESSGSDTFIQWHGATTSAYFDSLIIPATNIIIEGNAKTTSTPSTFRFGISNNADMSVNDNLRIESDSPNDLRYGAARNNGTQSYVSEAPKLTNEVYYILKITRFDSESHYYVNDNEISTGVTSNHPDTNMGLTVQTTTGTFEQKWSFARKYTATEPTYTIGVTTAPEKFSAVSDSNGNVSIFERRKPVKLTHPGVLTDYQMYETFDYEAIMLDNFDDIRFVTQSGKHIPYWIETKTDGVSVKVWFMNNYVDGDTYIWMYYGSEGLSSGSSITNTMIYGDDFSSDLSKWSGDTAQFAVSGGELTNTPTTTSRTIYANVGSLSNTIIEAKIKTTDAATDLLFGLGYRIDGSNRALFARRQYTGYERRWGDGSTYYSTVPPQWTSGIYGVDKVIVGTTVANSIHSFNGTTITGVSNYNLDISTNLIIYSYSVGTPGVQYIDWIFVRKYTAVEPIVTVGAEQHPRTRNMIIS